MNTYVTLTPPLVYWIQCPSEISIPCDGRVANPDSMAVSNHTRNSTHAEGSSSVNAQLPSLEEYTRAHSASSNDCDWLLQLVSSDALSAGRISPRYLVRVYYNETEAASTTTTKDFGPGAFALLDLRHFLNTKYVRAVTLCHRDSSQVDPKILDLVE